MSKDEALYGVFNEADSDSDDDGGGRRRKKVSPPTHHPPTHLPNQSTNPLTHAPTHPQRGNRQRDKDAPLRAVAFVSGSRKRGREEEGEEEEEEEDGKWAGAGRGGLGYGGGKEEEEEEEEEEERMEVEDVKEKFQDLLKEGGARKEEEEEEEEGGGGGGGGVPGLGQDFFRGVLQAAEDKAAAEKAEKDAKEAELKARKAMPVRNDPGSMGWEAHTKGFASKFLAKFGFKGRLGKEETGITKVPEVVVRPDRLGLGT